MVKCSVGVRAFARYGAKRKPYSARKWQQGREIIGGCLDQIGILDLDRAFEGIEGGILRKDK